MLYVTTRNHQDAYTASHTLSEHRGSDGGFYVPLHLPKLSEQERSRFAQLSWGQCVAEILNLFFSAKLVGWDVDFSVGRYPVRLVPLVHKICLAETWHNPDWSYSRLENNLRQLLQAETDIPGNWGSIAVRMAVMAGLLGNQELLGAGPVDISVVSGDFSAPISAWYLREMGFPVGNIICCCNENNQFWDLICNGQMRTDAVSLPTIVPEADTVMPVHLERLISACGGIAETARYLDCCAAGATYCVSDTMLRQLRQGVYASVISSSRIETTIPNVYKSLNYIFTPASALAYAGLLDYRAKTGITRTGIVLCDQSPVCCLEQVADIMNIPAEEVKRMI